MDRYNKEISKVYIYTIFSNLSFFIPMQVMFFQKVGFNLTQVAFLFTALQLCKWIFEIPTGLIADKYGKKISSVLSIFFIILSYTIFLFSKNYNLFLIAMIINGIGYTMSTGAVDALLIESCTHNGYSNKLDEINATTRILFYFSYGLSVLLSGYIAEINFKILIILNIITLFISTLVLTTIKEYKDEKQKEKIKDKKLSRQGIKSVINELCSNKIILKIILIETFVALSMIPVDKFYTNYLYTNFDLKLTHIGIIVFIQMLICSFIGKIRTRIPSRFNDTMYINFGPIIMMLFFIIFSISNNLIVSIISYFTGLSAFCIYSPTLFKVLQNNIKDSQRATILSVKSLLMSLVSSLSQPLLGVLTYNIGFKFSMFILLLISTILLMILNVLCFNI